MECLWLEVTQDEYELPVIVEDSVEALARKLKIKPQSIYQIMSKYKKEGRRCRYISVKYKKGDYYDEML